MVHYKYFWWNILVVRFTTTVSTMLTIYCNDVITTHAHEWQLQLEFENGEDFRFFFYAKGDKLSSHWEITKVSVLLRFGAHSVGYSVFDNPCRGSWFHLQISRLLATTSRQKITQAQPVCKTFGPHNSLKSAWLKIESFSSFCHNFLVLHMDISAGIPGLGAVCL